MRELLAPRRGERLLPGLSGLMLAASFPPLHPLVLPFVALVPLAWWVAHLPPGPEGARAAVRGGVAFGTVLFVLLGHWVVTALLRFSWWAIPAFAGGLVLFSGWTALGTWALHRAVRGAGAPLWAALPVVWTAWEWGRGVWPGSLAFPWLGLGTSLTGFPELVGVAELVGATGVGFWLAGVNGLLATLLLRREQGRGWGTPAAALTAAVLLPAAWGVWRAATLELRPTARVAVLQPNVAQEVKLDPAAALDSALASLERLVPLLEPGSVDLVVLPEMVVPVRARHPASAAVVHRLQAHAREVGAPVLFGAVGGRGEGEGRFNSAFLVRPQGLATFQYDKRHLVPGVERTPGSPPWTGTGPLWGGFGVGEGWPLAEVTGARAGVLICYESAFPGLARRFRLEGADILVNITNDAWLGGEAPWTRSVALWQHPAHAVMRAIETRAGVVRSANTGISLFVDPVGRVSGATPLFRPAVSTAVVSTSGITTFHTRHGELVGPAAAVAALLLILAGGRAGARPTLDRPRSGH